MREGSSSPEGQQPGESRPEDDKVFVIPDQESFLGTPEFEYLRRVPTDEELPAMQEWKKRNEDTLSKMSASKRRDAYYDALQELRAQRAREQIRQDRPDEAAEPDGGSAEGA